ncbi:hypothetical protein BC829DRAFT_446503 [Chytridium lagenaria]|nr:hypothetical protein BC829DRAFT_446503 [Chytridium lagenaria]
MLSATVLVVAAAALWMPSSADAALNPLSKSSGSGRYLRHMSPALTENQINVVNNCPWRWQVKSGDTCGSIAIALGTDTKTITSNNAGLDCNQLKKNDILCLSKTLDSPISSAFNSITENSLGASDNATFTCTQSITTTGQASCKNIKESNNVFSMVYLIKINPTLEDPIIPRGSVPVPIADCNKTVSIRLDSTCDRIAEDNNIRTQTLFLLNANLTCTKLTDNIGSDVCVGSSGRFNTTPLPTSRPGPTATTTDETLLRLPPTRPKPSPPPPPPPPPPPSEEDRCLDMHNTHRMWIYNGDGNRYVHWDDGLKWQAQDIANNLANNYCTLDHGTDKEKTFTCRVVAMKLMTGVPPLREFGLTRGTALAGTTMLRNFLGLQ